MLVSARKTLQVPAEHDRASLAMAMLTGTADIFHRQNAISNESYYPGVLCMGLDFENSLLIWQV